MLWHFKLNPPTSIRYEFLRVCDSSPILSGRVTPIARRIEMVICLDHSATLLSKQSEPNSGLCRSTRCIWSQKLCKLISSYENSVNWNTLCFQQLCFFIFCLDAFDLCIRMDFDFFPYMWYCVNYWFKNRNYLVWKQKFNVWNNFRVNFQPLKGFCWILLLRISSEIYTGLKIILSSFDRLIDCDFI